MKDVGLRGSQKGFSSLELVLILTVIILLVVGGFYIWQQSKGGEGELVTSSDSALVNEKDGDLLQVDVPEGFSVYENSEIGISFYYPSEWGEVNLSQGVIDQDQENGESYKGSFSDNSLASFALLSSDWEYLGPGRGGPSHATGFTEYTQVDDHQFSGATYMIKQSTSAQQLYAYNDMDAMISVSAQRRFDNNKANLVGVEFKLLIDDIPEGYDNFSDSPDSVVRPWHFETMQTVLDSVKEI